MLHSLLNQRKIMKLRPYLLSFLCVCVIAAAGVTATPKKINYQGKLMENGAPVGNTAPVPKPVTFKLFNAAGQELWSSGQQTVTVSKGLFNYVLGEHVTLDNIDWESGPVYLEIVVNNTILSPREQLTNSAYAFLAEDVAHNIVSSINNVVNDCGNIDLVAGTSVNIKHLTGTNQIEISATATGSAGGDIDAVIAGQGLTGGATAGTATLNIGQGLGITVNADNIEAVLGDSIDTNEIVDGTINTIDLKDQAVTSAKIANDTIATADLANGAVTSLKIADGSIATADLANGAVTSAKVASNSLTEAHLATNIVSSIDGVVNDGGNIDLVAGPNITITPNDAANIITIGASGSAIGNAITDVDGDTKIQTEESVGDNKIRFDTLGSERMVIDSNGRIGIGVVSPSYLLDVAGTIRATAFIGDGSGLTGITLTESDPQVGANTTNYISKWNGSSLISGTIFDNGNIGIGTPTPQAKLHIDGTPGTDGIMFPDGSLQTTAAGGGFGVWNDRDKDGVVDTVTPTDGIIYTAQTDGFVIAFGGSTGTEYYIETPVGTKRYQEISSVWHATSIWRHLGGTVPVRKGDTWRVIGFTTVYWIPLGN